MGSIPAEAEGFKACPLCGEQWPTIEDLVRDRRLQLNGYMADFDDPAAGLIFLTHKHLGCGTTMALRAGRLRSLCREPEHAESHLGLDGCRQLCIERQALEDCDQPCKMAWVRKVLQVLRRHGDV